ncbi:MAG: family 16 glycosylhydrolase [Gammaproteobacteria bacterium]|nr:family 16 glycosylhydrolase [Gammaproteobacteria bacterium]
MKKLHWTAVLTMASALLLSGCAEDGPDPIQEWAVNVGGPAYTGVDGVAYVAEEYVSGGETGSLETVLGSQDEPLYHTYRVGDIRVDRPLANGLYDVILHFAEPEEIEGRERLFDVLVNGEKRVDSLDVMVSRDGKIRSALTVAVPDVRVTDGRLQIEFNAIRREPVLSAVAIRAKPVATDRWSLVWQDEFDYEGPPDPAKWNVEEWPARKVNDEDQAYTLRPENVRVENGNLVIEAHREDYDNAKYTSARIQSQGKGDFLYGRIEARAKLPRGMGSWPAIWMLPSDPFTYATTCADDPDWQGSADCDAWPNSGEIDILEHVGYEMGHVHGTVHTKAYYWAVWQQRKGRIIVDDVDEEFHDYVLEWSPQRIDIFVDDSLYFTYVNEGKGWEVWPFDKPFHLIINIAVGGMWGRAGGGIDDSIFPQRLLVDYVRVYEST